MDVETTMVGDLTMEEEETMENDPIMVEAETTKALLDMETTTKETLIGSANQILEWEAVKVVTGNHHAGTQSRRTIMMMMTSILMTGMMWKILKSLDGNEGHRSEFHHSMRR